MEWSFPSTNNGQIVGVANAGRYICNICTSGGNEKKRV